MSLDQRRSTIKMEALNIGLIFLIIFRWSSANDMLVPPSSCPLDNASYLPIYDLVNVTYNVLRYDEFLASFLKDGFFQFKDVETKMIGEMFYGDYPVFVVYQPDENVPELHGYHYPFPWGLQLIYATDRFDSSVYAQYQHFRDYLNSPINKEGYTPSAALQIYPELESMKLTNIVQDPNEEKITAGFTLLFLLPKKDSIKGENFEKEYSLFEEYYYNGTKICQVKAEYEDFEEDEKYVPLLTVYSHYPDNSFDNKEKTNVVDLDQLNEYFSKYGFYKFENFVADFSPYNQHPILIVFQPSEAVPELHGYYFDEKLELLKTLRPYLQQIWNETDETACYPRGILSLVSYVDDNPEFLEEYRPFFEYIQSEPDVDGLTPEAARFDYPYFFDYKLTTFTHGENVSSQFAILFLAPTRYRPASFLEKYSVIEDYGIGDKYIVQYQVGQNEVYK